MQPPNHRDRILTTLHYTTACRCDRFHCAVETALDAEPGNLGEHWCWQEDDAGSSFRITGLDLYGDIYIDVVPGKKRSSRSEVTVHCREGDLALVKRLEAALGDELMRPAQAETSASASPFDSIAQVFQAFQQTAGTGIVVTDSAVDSALECIFNRVPRTLEEIKRLDGLRRAAEMDKLGGKHPGYTKADLAQYLRRWPNPRLALHYGEKVYLHQQLHITDEHEILTLKVHFGYLPKTREHVIGWVEESFRAPFDEELE